MNWERMAGKWTEFKHKVRDRWTKLTEEDLTRIAGKRDQLLAALQERYGWVREQAERQVKDFEAGPIPMSTGRSEPLPETDDEGEESLRSR